MFNIQQMGSNTLNPWHGLSTINTENGLWWSEPSFSPNLLIQIKCDVKTYIKELLDNWLDSLRCQFAHKSSKNFTDQKLTDDCDDEARKNEKIHNNLVSVFKKTSCTGVNLT